MRGGYSKEKWRPQGVRETHLALHYCTGDDDRRCSANQYKSRINGVTGRMDKERVGWPFLIHLQQQKHNAAVKAGENDVWSRAFH